MIYFFLGCLVAGSFLLRVCDIGFNGRAYSLLLREKRSKRESKLHGKARGDFARRFRVSKASKAQQSFQCKSCWRQTTIDGVEVLFGESCSRAQRKWIRELRSWVPVKAIATSDLFTVGSCIRLTGLPFRRTAHHKLPATHIFNPIHQELVA